MDSQAAAIETFDDETRASIAQALWMDRFDPVQLPAGVAERLADPKNSPKSHGDRMRAFLRYLIDHPVSRTPSYRRIYERLLPHCDTLSPHETYVLATAFLGPPATVGYDMVPTKPDFEFPRDHSPKLRSQVGWHFFVGSCWDTDGAEYGVELMFFQTALYPPGIAAGFGLTDEENQVVELQLAISERGGRHFQAEPVVLAGTSGLVSSTPDPFTYRLGKNSIECHRAGEFFPLTVKAWGVDRGEAAPLQLGMNLTFSSGKETLFQGEGGCMPAVDGFGSLYYSIPNIQVDPVSGSTLELDGRTVTLERGTFWFDHQWGYIAGAPRSTVMRAANNTTNPPPAGWDWFMAQFDGDRQLTVFAPHTAAYARFYEQAGDAPPATMRVAVSGTYMNPDSSTHIIRGSLDIDDWIKAEHSPNPARYLVTDTWYPNRWTFAFDEGVPEDIRTFTMAPIVDTAQSGYFANGAQYAEGAVILTTSSGADVGRGFAESVAYADTRRTQHRLAGLPETDDAIHALRVSRTPMPLRWSNAVFVMRRRRDLERILADAAGLEFFTKPAAR